MDDDNIPEVTVIRVGDPTRGGQGGFYNAIFPGGFERGDLLLPHLLGTRKPWTVGRFRDCWIERWPEPDGLLLRVYTRNGRLGAGDEYHDGVLWARAHALFVRERRDTFDDAYTSYWFRMPPVEPGNLIRGPAYFEALADIAIDPVDTDARWRLAMDVITKGAGRTP